MTCEISTAPIVITTFSGHSQFRLIDELKQRGLWTLVCSIAKAHFTTPAAVVGRGRLKRNVLARQAVWASLYAMPDYSLTDLGLIFDRDHTTILMGIRRHEARLTRTAQRPEAST